MNDWNLEDYSLLAAALSGIHADMESSKRAQKAGGKEYNPLLGKHPTDQEFDRYGIASGLVTTLLANLVEGKTRKIGLGALAGFEHGLAMKNDEAVRNKQERLDLTKPIIAAAIGGLLGYAINDEDSPVSAAIKSDGGKPEVMVSYKKRF